MALPLSEGLGRTGEEPLKPWGCMDFILAAPERAGKSSRGTPRLRGLQQPCMAPCALLGDTAGVAEAKRYASLVGMPTAVATEPPSPPLAASSCVWMAGFKPALTEGHGPFEPDGE